MVPSARLFPFLHSGIRVALLAEGLLLCVEFRHIMAKYTIDVCSEKNWFIVQKFDDDTAESSAQYLVKQDIWIGEE
jgi:hypothetical protein